MKAIEWLEGEIEPMNETVVYSLDKARAKFEVRDLCQNGYLVLNWDHTDPDKRLWLKFAVLEFNHSDCDDTNTFLSLVYHGEGPSSALRECRHTYWGEDGYLFYPKGQIIKAAFNALAEFFDEME